jgi:RNA polymerase sigma-70 factor (ECF subfamily)
LAHSEFIKTIAQKLLYHQDDADDVIQQTWLAALHKPPDPEKPVRRWLALVARNNAIEMLRKRGRRLRGERRAARAEALPSAGDAVAREAVLGLVAEAVRKLNEPYRSTVLLHYYEGLPPRAIARRLAVPVETVRTRLKRGLSLLRRRLDRRRSGDRRTWVEALAPWIVVGTRRASRGRYSDASSLPAKATSAALASVAAFWICLQGWKLIADPGQPRAPSPAASAGLELAALQDSPHLRGAPARVGVAVDATHVHVVRADDGLDVQGAHVVVTCAENATLDGVSDGHGDLDLALPKGRSVVIDVGATQRSFPLHRMLRPGWEADACESLTLRVPAASSVAGVVVDSDGRPMANAVVDAWSGAPPRSARDATSSPSRSTTTDAAGAFRFEGLPKKFFLCASTATLVGSQRMIAELERADDLTDVELVVVDAQAVQGRITNRRGAPIAGAVIDVVGNDGGAPAVYAGSTLGISYSPPLGQWTTSAADGSFRLAAVPRGPALIRASASDYLPARREVSAGDAGLELVLDEGMQCVVRVFDSRRRALSGALVEAYDAAIPLQRAVTDERGFASMRCRAGPRQTLFLRVTAPDHAATARTIVGPREGQAPIVIQLAEARALTGRITRSDGTPERSTVRVRSAGLADSLQVLKPVTNNLLNRARTLAEVESDGDGVFTVDALPSERLELEVVPHDGARSTRFIPVDPAQTSVDCVVDRSEPRDVRVRGRIVDARTLEPIRSAAKRVYALESNGELRQVSSELDSAGRFELFLPSPASWTIRVEAKGFAPRCVELSQPAVQHLGDIALSPARDLNLKILDRNGLAVEQGVLVVADERGDPVLVPVNARNERSFVRTGPHGAAHMHRLPASKIELKFVPPLPFEPETRWIDLEDEVKETLEWRLEHVDLSERRRTVELDLRTATDARDGVAAFSRSRASAPPFKGECRIDVFDDNERLITHCTTSWNDDALQIDPELWCRQLVQDDHGAPQWIWTSPLAKQWWYGSERSGESPGQYQVLRLSLPLAASRILATARDGRTARAVLPASAAFEPVSPTRLMVLFEDAAR